MGPVYRKSKLLRGAAATALGLASALVAAAAKADDASSGYAANIFPSEQVGQDGGERLVALGGSVMPHYGNINPFYGNINPFFGNISPFYGNIQPFWGDINPFYGNIQPFWGDLNPFYGNINPFWGNIQPFWNDLAPLWGSINPFWGTLQPFTGANAGEYDQLQGMMQDFYARSEATWAARVTQSTGKNFYDGFAKKIFDKYGLDLDTPASLSGMTAENRARFMLDWYDGLMEFSGMDHVDHWMATVNWNPAITQDQGKGADTTIGILDARITGDDDLLDNIEYAGGYDTGVANDHGAAVASLIYSEHDGKGVMGIAPSAQVIAYNPFDETNTAGWQDVRDGIVALADHGADVINISLGVPGYTFHQGMADIISDPTLKNELKDILFVVAAGNDGVTQTENVNWGSGVSADNLIVVGSLGLDGNISSFSNKPGEVCLNGAGTCATDDMLKYHFLVAPGELLLVSDNHGGVTRMSGTSFAAPLVSGAVALLYDRWPWLQKRPETAAQILFESAQDLGDAGVDAVYGWGLLDVEASQSPLSFDDLVVYQGYNQIKSNDLKSMALSSTKRAAWEASGASLYAFEFIDGTYRDFAIPLSTLLYGKSYSRYGSSERFQRYMYGRLIDWANGNKFTDMPTTEVQGGDVMGWSVNFTATESNQYADYYNPEMPFEVGYEFENKKTGLGLQFGFGNGASTLFAQPGFGFYSDYDAGTGGVNPVLGFAIGDMYAGASYDVSENAKLTFGYSQYEEDQNGADPVTGNAKQIVPGISAYAADAAVLSLAYTPVDWAAYNITYTQLTEQTGLLGVQGAGALSLAGGAKTDAVTMGAEFKLDADLSLAFSATAAHTRPGAFEDSGLAVSDEGITSTAFEVALNMQGVFDKTDGIRFALTQPLTIESGSLNYTSWQVVDRDTGEIGLVTEQWNLASDERPLVAEVLYATPVLDGAGELSLVAKVNLTGGGADEDQGVTIGSRLALKW